MTLRLAPRSLQGQLLLAIALALLAAQGIGAALLYRSMAERREAALVNSAAFRLANAIDGRDRDASERGRRGPRLRVETSTHTPQLPGERPDLQAAAMLGEILNREGVEFTHAVVIERRVSNDYLAKEWLARRGHRLPPSLRERPRELMVAGIRQPDGTWRHARVLIPGSDRRLLTTMLLQTLFTYIVLVGAVALVLRRITRPLKALTRRMDRFAGTRDGVPALAPQGPDDIRELIVAHNALEARIGALLDEKDVMLGAIGHDLKTPLAALRVRIESVEDESERTKMAGTIEDIARSLDDILSLARVGRPFDPLEPTELGALAASVVEEYEDRGEPVTLADTLRIVLPARATWLRRALRNLIDNALRYGGTARVSLDRTDGRAIVRIDDDGPGIPPGEIARMLEPFTRLEASRNTATGGTGLGLTLARAVAEQHGGALILANRRGGGLSASISLPLV